MTTAYLQSSLATNYAIDPTAKSPYQPKDPTTKFIVMPKKIFE